MNFDQIIDAIKKEEISLEDFAWGNFDSPEEVGEFKQIAQVGGEGEGDLWYAIFYFLKHDIYVRIEGHYTSHYGTDFYGWEYVTEVRPKEKTITVYE